MVAKLASLSSSSRAVRGKLQAALYYGREKNRAARIAANAPMSFAGALVGDIADDGALPTGWLWEMGFSDGITLEVVSLEQHSNVPTIIFRMHGTNNLGNTAYPGIRVRTIASVEDEEYTFSLIGEILDETAPFAEEPRISVQSRLDNGYVASTNGLLPADFENVEVVNTTAPTANQIVLFLLDNSLAPAQSVDVTIQVAMLRVKRTG